VNSKIPAFQDYGAYVGASVSGSFLLLIGVLNLVVLLDILGVFRRMKRGHYDEQKLEQALLNQGLMSRFFLRRVGDRIDRSWKMYPLGILFGLGFDTATEIGLLALAAGVATHNVPFLAIVSLPIIFAAGMSLMDTADGAFMSHAYGWAFSNPVRKVYYNITVTSHSVTGALVIGTIELLQVAAAKLSLDGPFWTFLDELDFGRIGYVVVALFVATWAFSLVLWKARRIEERWGRMVEVEP
jgi:high-affinity nickel-transport protein